MQADFTTEFLFNREDEWAEDFEATLVGNRGRVAKIDADRNLTEGGKRARKQEMAQATWDSLLEAQAPRLERLKIPDRMGRGRRPQPRQSLPRPGRGGPERPAADPD